MRFLPAVVLAASLAAQNRPNLAGVWQLNKEKSHVDVRMAWARLELMRGTFSVNLRVFPDGAPEETFDWHFTIGAGESSNLMHGAPMKSRVEWEDGTLVVRSITMFGSDPLNTVDRWTASLDGRVLTLTENHQSGNEPEGVSLFVFERRPASAWPAVESKPAEQVYRNIHVLRSLPAERLPVVMAVFARSLGVACTHCHVAGEFSSDAKPAKSTARKMLEMVSAINRQWFADSEGITCWTCHRGSVKPEREQSAAVP